MASFSGIWVALVTPFNNNAVDLPAVKRLAQYLIASGVSGLVVCGTTGEAAALSNEEQLAVLDAVLDVVPASQVVMGLSGNNMLDTLQMQQEIQLRDIAGVLIPAPYYIRPSQCGLVDYFTQLADASSVPVILYNIPQRTGIVMELQTIRKIARHPQVKAIKDCGGNPDTTMALIDDGEIDVMTGEDNLILTTLCLGGTGAISASAHIYPQRFVQLVQQVADGDLAAARANFYALLPMIHQMFSFPNPAPVKAALAQQGLIRNELRSPMQIVPQPLQQQIAVTLAQLQPEEALIS
ncbi:4-hydroxy-tetrahydrodipicolinate synthase [Serratia sp. TSA_198.1]|jgi:4-hydroxy-tetrahydrodipicolinate synthase|uniref:4-hydroxy-tetrahydrodipicolinate synthase n=2 Tax=Serratia plymuthica TaxID=82996 RepID=A0A2X4UKG2_SERPL|nr:4-hydroxy-tetrahydrodipicolinate synthase [Serratia plymuthica]AGP44304.1 dihydrodipicolinate synthase [Serratia plymuthica S13]KYG15218.1 4-hydroxy-tetrahydrodipicolinate synthase [Serratia plymuthica]NIC26662.1 4-hydroxy-tetrahydrodipicolinate synthase [Serratia plymuthica]QPS21074.1 4-hydroxy-tetrahydrodipicolinate synthase [Serratia plymuthica]QPS53960.1 4-hydroxy-tetrahydrodipicolinate synthase [Serratia plymuthica]